MTLVLGILLVAVLLGPFLFTFAERNLEFYLLALGICAVAVSGLWSAEIVLTAAKDPIAITCAVLIAGVSYARFKSLSVVPSILSNMLFPLAFS